MRCGRCPGHYRRPGRRTAGHIIVIVIVEHQLGLLGQTQHRTFRWTDCPFVRGVARLFLTGLRLVDLGVVCLRRVERKIVVIAVVAAIAAFAAIIGIGIDTTTTATATATATVTATVGRARIQSRAPVCGRSWPCVGGWAFIVLVGRRLLRGVLGGNRMPAHDVETIHLRRPPRSATARLSNIRDWTGSMPMRAQKTRLQQTLGLSARRKRAPIAVLVNDSNHR